MKAVTALSAADEDPDGSDGNLSAVTKGELAAAKNELILEQRSMSAFLHRFHSHSNVSLLKTSKRGIGNLIECELQR